MRVKKDKHSSLEYQPVASKDKAEVSFDTRARTQGNNKRDLELKDKARKGSFTSDDSVTPRDFVSTTSLPVDT